MQDFVIIAAMRTGSNFIERVIDSHPECCCYGESFNKGFVGLHHQNPNALGIFDKKNIEKRNSNVNKFIEELNGYARGKKWGFRIFDNHNNHVLNSLIDNKKIKKIILKRNLLESYYSLLLAEKTNVWLIDNNITTKVEEKYSSFSSFEINKDSFKAYIEKTNAFYDKITERLIEQNQKHFKLNYCEINNKVVINKLFEFIGVEEYNAIDKVTIIKQTKKPLSEVIINYEELIKII